MEITILLLLIMGTILYAMIRGSIEEKNGKKRYRQQLKDSYGHFPQREYTSEELQSIPRLYEHRRNADSLDDITWNDLEMDSVYQLLNHTQSSSGAEYLYWMLRTPALNGDDTETLEQSITHFMEQEDSRISAQMALHNLGKTGRFSLFDYLDYLDTLGTRRNTKHLVGILALLVSIGTIFLSANIGVVLLIAVMCVQLVTYMQEKKQVLPYISSFAYIMRMLDCADGILQANSSSLPCMNQMQQDKAQLHSFRKGYRYLFRMNTSSGNPIEIIMEYFKMITHIDLIQFNKTLRVVQENRQNIISLTLNIGYIDTVISIGAFRNSLPYYCVPNLSAHATDFCVEGGFHPSIAEPVPNGFCQERGMLITGSNASGKSTFLKMTAINAVLAQTLHTCAAKVYRGSFFRIYSSMALRDNLTSSESYYIVEIKALKRIMDQIEIADSANPLLCFIDEVLRGTNTVERIAASAQILTALSQRNIYCFAATHDIELTHLLESQYDNFHFEEEVREGDVLFSYHLLEGRAQTRNAIKLLQVIGFSDNIILQAEKMAGRFAETGEWS